MTLEEFLEDLGLTEYLKNFTDEGAEQLADLIGLTEQDLTEVCGITKLVHRRKLMKAIRSLPASDEDTQLPPSTLPIDIEALPSAIALPLRAYEKETHPVLKLWAACDTVEMLLRLLVITFIAEQQEGGKLKQELAREVSDLIELPKLNNWFSLAGTLSKSKPDNTLLPEALECIEGPLRDLLHGTENPGTPETSFLQLRNRLAHGGGLLEKESARLFTHWQKPFETALKAIKWLEEVALIGRSENGSMVRLVGTGEPEPYYLDEGMNLTDSSSLWLYRGQSNCKLWPLAIYGHALAQTKLASRQSGNPYAQIYSRKESITLTYTPIGSTGFCQSESGRKELDAFEALFSVDVTNRKNAFSIKDFNKDMMRDARQMVGREQELVEIRKALTDGKQNVLWLYGPAGMGKSVLMARLFVDLSAECTSDTHWHVMAYRFRLGDSDRCNRSAFATFVYERLHAWRLIRDEVEVDTKAKPSDQIQQCLNGLKKGHRLTLLLDGLDEIARSDSDFILDIPLGIHSVQVNWLLAGRPERALVQVMREHAIKSVFANGLPPMNENDIRGMILDKIGSLRNRLLKNDHEEEGNVINPFISQVTRHAEGFPLYVRYVIGDILNNKYRVLDADEPLPESLYAYHEDLIKGLGIGSLQQLLTPLVCLLAVAEDALSYEELQSLLVFWKVIPDTHEGSTLLQEGLSAIASLLKTEVVKEQRNILLEMSMRSQREINTSTTTSYTLFHSSLREHLLQSNTVKPTIASAKTIFAELAELKEFPIDLERYMYRYGVDHLISLRQTEAAKRRLLNLQDLYTYKHLGISFQKFYDWWNCLGGEQEALEYLKYIDSIDVNEVEVSYCWSPPFLSMIDLFNICVKYDWCRLGIPLGKKILEFCQSSHLLDHIDEWGFTEQLATLHAENADYASAEPLLSRVHEEKLRILGDEHSDTLYALSNLGLIHDHDGNYSEAEHIFRRCLTILERTLGAGHWRTLIPLGYLGSLLFSKGDYDTAEPLLRRCLEGREQTAGEEHTDTLTALSTLGKFLKSKGDLYEAETLTRRCLEIRERIFGSEHPKTLYSANLLGEILESMGDHAGADKLFNRCKDARERAQAAIDS